MDLANELLDLLRCPRCKGQLRVCEPPVTALECGTCALRFPVRDGIPIMLLDGAEAV